MISLNNGITNIANTPGAITDVIANRPANALGGTVFISTDTQEIYSFDGTNWILVTSGTGGGPTGWDTMLAQGQAQTAYRTINLNNNDLSFYNNADIVLQLQNNTSLLLNLLQYGDIFNFTTIGNSVVCFADGIGNTSYLTTLYKNVNSGLNFNYVGQVYEIGDMGLNSKGTYLKINDGAQQISTFWYDTVTSLTYNDGINIDYSNQLYQFGLLSTGSATQLSVQNNDIGFKRNGLNFGINANYTTSLYKFGAIDGNNQTTLNIDDSAKRFYTNFYDGSNYKLLGFDIQPSYINFGFINALSGVYNQMYIDISNDAFGSGDEYIKTVYNSNQEGLNIDFAQGIYQLYGNAFNTAITLQDNSTGGKTIQMNCNTPIQLDDNGTGNFLEVNSGGNANLHWVVKINGTLYKVKLDNY